ncbi:DUF5707 domain-containing protein [Streptomyces niveus]|uniref:DUF5707 domain-containing protein n=1 Tax=Streptomyces niveus TaxID=193462 RepID=UPI002E2FE328|nr:DUF5707 domain-containing protein [Streptomyces niveus]
MSRMSKRVVLTSLVGTAAVAGIAVAGIASATAPSAPTVDNASARFLPPSADTGGTFAFAADVADDSGVKSLKVLAWPNSSDLKPTAEEMEHAENAVCERVDDEKSTCAYTLRISGQEARGMRKGDWTISVLLTARDGEKKFVPEATTINIDF